MKTTPRSIWERLMSYFRKPQRTVDPFRGSSAKKGTVDCGNSIYYVKGRHPIRISEQRAAELK